MTLKSWAKLNLSLQILKKREDGFHELKTLMMPLPNLADRITFKRVEKFSFSCSDKSLPTTEDNLVIKAYNSFAKSTGLSPKFHLHLEKNIPHGAGLGGGSSNSAITLRSLNELENNPLSEPQLTEMASQIGSDVPFFLQKEAAWASGRGEQIAPIPLNLENPILLLKPGFRVSTVTAYQAWETSQELSKFTYKEQNFGALSLRNDLERPVFAKFPFLGLLKNWLLQQIEVNVALMSGSGSTMFAILESNSDPEELASRAKEQWDPELWHYVIAPTSKVPKNSA